GGALLAVPVARRPLRGHRRRSRRRSASGRQRARQAALLPRGWPVSPL
ncbi:MAG: hypothetical protein AVDCRST_MAG73-1287, partial [uncultured Thermomicrobiales bacterium]